MNWVSSPHQANLSSNYWHWHCRPIGYTHNTVTNETLAIHAQSLTIIQMSWKGQIFLGPVPPVSFTEPITKSIEIIIVYSNNKDGCTFITIISITVVHIVAFQFDEICILILGAPNIMAVISRPWSWIRYEVRLNYPIKYNPKLNPPNPVRLLKVLY